MRLLQNSGVPPCYLSRPKDVHDGVPFKNQIERFLDHRYGALHFLLPVLNGDDRTFFTNGDDEVLQRTWAREMGLPAKVSLADILLAQMESHRTEVFYNLDPVRYDSDFVHRMPGCVRKAIAWRNIPSPLADFGGYDFIVCNSPSLVKRYEGFGWKAAFPWEQLHRIWPCLSLLSVFRPSLSFTKSKTSSFIGRRSHGACLPSVCAAWHRCFAPELRKM